MAGYSWSEMRSGGTYRLPGPEHLGWWAAIAMLLSIILHIAVFFLLDEMKIALRFEQAREISTRNIDLRPVEYPPEKTTTPVPEETITPPVDAASLLEEVDLLKALPKDAEIDIQPSIEEPEYALKMQQPAQEGDPAAIAMEVTRSLDVDTDMPELGREPHQLRPAEIGQVTVDPGAVPNDDSLRKFTDNLLKRGAKGRVEKGALDGVASLDDLLGLPPNVLLGKKTMLPSDLLFEFNRDELRESAKVGLMKLALLMDRNPGLYCWIEGHTDLVGGDEFNLNLSLRRAEAVKSYLTNSLRLDASKIHTRGFGRHHPIVKAGSADEQAINRRVEIRMRKTPPPPGPPASPPKAPVIEETTAPKAPVIEQPPPPKPVLVKPRRAIPVEESNKDDAAPPPAPRAQPVDTTPPPAAVPKATPVAPDIPPPPAAPRAQPVAEE